MCPNHVCLVSHLLAQLQHLEKCWKGCSLEDNIILNILNIHIMLYGTCFEVSVRSHGDAINACLTRQYE